MTISNIGEGFPAEGAESITLPLDETALLAAKNAKPIDEKPSDEDNGPKYPEGDNGPSTEETKEVPVANAEEQPKEFGDTGLSQAVIEHLSSSGVDVSEITNEFSTSGTLSDETIKTISEKSGIPEDAVRDHVELKKFQVEYTNNVLNEASGGDFQALLGKAKDTLSHNKLVSFQKQYNTSTTLTELKAVTASLKEAVEAVRGNETAPLKGKVGASRAVFKSQAELTRAMSDPRYKAGNPKFDPAYANWVRETLQNSNSI